MHAGSLGELVFEVSSEQLLLLRTFSVSLDARYEDHVVQGWLPQPEFLGPNLATHNLSILLRRDFLGHSPVEEIRLAQAMLVNGQVERLVVGGVGYGKVTIRKMDYTWNHLIKGRKGPYSVSMNLELKEYV